MGKRRDRRQPFIQNDNVTQNVLHCLARNVVTLVRHLLAPCFPKLLARAWHRASHELPKAVCCTALQTAVTHLQCFDEITGTKITGAAIIPHVDVLITALRCYGVN